MGSNVSVQESSVFRQVVTDLSLRSVFENIQSDTDTTTISQIQKGFNFKNAKINCGSLIFDQNAIVTKKVYRKMTDEQEQNFKQDLQQQLTDTFKNVSEQTLSGLNLFQSNVSKINNELSTINVADLSTKIASKVKKDVNTTINLSQLQGDMNFEGAEINPDPVTNKCDLKFTQNVNLEQVTENAVNSVLNTENIATNALSATSESDIKGGQKSTGIDPFAWIGIALAIIIVVVLVSMGISKSITGKFLFNPFKKKSKENNEIMTNFGKFLGFGKKKRRRRRS